jgi:hypothetical protein
MTSLGQYAPATGQQRTASPSIYRWKSRSSHDFGCRSGVGSDLGGTLFRFSSARRVKYPVPWRRLSQSRAEQQAQGVWYARERTLSIHSIVTQPRELFYWLAVLV